ncbi:hypothetical protein IEQ34_002297 [Dendrobium chrysotoxum]|uniref:Uncharacterized protein n=1 Tax=Dendrobium chrysotoxum TaxID=161865 RepID=A0AAV7H4K6_DENCH|nr:hypothetical protein IEQ34_002297 [Dendrobium chrysotoxum]
MGQGLKKITCKTKKRPGAESLLPWSGGDRQIRARAEQGFICFSFCSTRRISTPISIEGDNIEPVNTETGRLDDHLHSYVGSHPGNENDLHNDNNDINEEVERWTNENQVNDVEEVDDIIGRKKKKKTFKVWDEFKEGILPAGQRLDDHIHLIFEA